MLIWKSLLVCEGVWEQCGCICWHSYSHLHVDGKVFVTAEETSFFLSSILNLSFAMVIQRFVPLSYYCLDITASL